MTASPATTIPGTAPQGHANESGSESRWAAYKRIQSYGTVPGSTTTLLSSTTKMPSESWSLPAHQACPAAVTGPGTICGSCYASKNMYRQTRVQQAQGRRFAWAVQCMRTEEGRQTFVDTLVAAIGASENPYFRVHDSGDLFSPAYVRAWTAVARALPEKRFWIPTRVWRFLDRPAWHDALLELASLPNVTLRPSALYFDEPAPMIEGFAAGTTATTGGYTCPAPTQNNECRDCRVCWDRPDVAVSYHKH